MTAKDWASRVAIVALTVDGSVDLEVLFLEVTSSFASIHGHHPHTTIHQIIRVGEYFALWGFQVTELFCITVTTHATSTVEIVSRYTDTNLFRRK